MTSHGKTHYQSHPTAPTVLACILYPDGDHTNLQLESSFLRLSTERPYRDETGFARGGRAARCISARSDSYLPVANLSGPLQEHHERCDYQCEHGNRGAPSDPVQSHVSTRQVRYSFDRPNEQQQQGAYKNTACRHDPKRVHRFSSSRVLRCVRGVASCPLPKPACCRRCGLGERFEQLFEEIRRLNDCRNSAACASRSGLTRSRTSSWHSVSAARSAQHNFTSPAIASRLMKRSWQCSTSCGLASGLDRRAA